MRTRLVASVVVLLVGGLAWVGCEASAGTKPVRFEKDRGMTEPKLVQRVEPVYPEEARADGVQGVVVLDAVVDTDGKVTEATAVKDPDPRLTKAATDAVLQWKFEPARDAQGKPVAVVYTVTVAFKLQ